MKDNSRIFWAIAFILLGTILLFENLDFLSFSFSRIWKFWPLLLVYLGINQLSYRIPNGKLWSSLAGFILLVFLVMMGLHKPTKEEEEDSDFDENKIENGIEDIFKENVRVKSEENTVDSIATQSFTFKLLSEELDLSAHKEKTVVLDAEGKGALFNFNPSSNQGKFEFVSTSDNSDDENGDVQVELDDTKQWDLNIQRGGGKSKLSLANLPIKSLRFNAESGEHSFKFGAFTDSASVAIDTQDGELDLKFPSDCMIKLSLTGEHSDKSIENFELVKEGNYIGKPKNGQKKIVFVEITGKTDHLKLSRY